MFMCFPWPSSGYLAVAFSLRVVAAEASGGIVNTTLWWRPPKAPHVRYINRPRYSDLHCTKHFICYVLVLTNLFWFQLCWSREGQRCLSGGWRCTSRLSIAIRFDLLHWLKIYLNQQKSAAEEGSAYRNDIRKICTSKIWTIHLKWRNAFH